MISPGVPFSFQSYGVMNNIPVSVGCNYSQEMSETCRLLMKFRCAWYVHMTSCDDETLKLTSIVVDCHEVQWLIMLS